jgi:hypothetical protein
MTWFEFIMVCIKFDCGMDDHCNIQHHTLISFTLNTCVQYSMQRNCTRKEKKETFSLGPGLEAPLLPVGITNQD